MKCRLCGVELAPLRAVSDGLFCSARHKKRYEEAQTGEVAPQLASSLIPLDWWTFEPALPAYAFLADPTESATLYSERPQLLTRSGRVAFAAQMAVQERLFGLPHIAHVLADGPKAIAPPAAAVDFGAKAQLPSFPRIVSDVPAAEPVGVIEKLFALPMLGPVPAAEPGLITTQAAAIDLSAAPHLPALGRVAPARTLPVSDAVVPLREELFSLPFVSPAVAGAPQLAHLSVALAIGSRPLLPSSVRIAPASTFEVPKAAAELAPVREQLIEELFKLPVIAAVNAAEPQPIAHIAAGVDILKKPHLLSSRIEPSLSRLSDLLSAPALAVAQKSAAQTLDAAFAQTPASIPEVAPVAKSEEAAPTAPMASTASEEKPQPTVDEPAEEALRDLAGRAAATIPWWTRIPRMWGGLPVHVRALAMVAPIALILAFSRSLPSVTGTLGSTNSTQIQRMVSESLGSVRQQLASRAAIDFTDDFRTGLDDWQGRGNTTAEWSYDAAGFVRPAKLALFRPTLALQDYRFEFLGEIDEKAMGCVFRAVDPDNYYAIKFAISNPGPMPLVKLVRYAVVNGKEERHEERPLPFLSSADTLYRVLIDIHGGDFTIMSQGKVVDFWSDNRLKTGGVGLFCGRGEKARIRWVEVSHQYDTLGRLCAYLAPYSSGQTRSGSLN
jgi:hypothetical protein